MSIASQSSGRRVRCGGPAGSAPPLSPPGHGENPPQVSSRLKTSARACLAAAVVCLVADAGGGAEPAVPGGPDVRLPAPVAHWTFDEEGPEAVDRAGGHTGAIRGAVRHPGRLGGALLFDRARRDHVSVPHAADLELSTFTVSAWVRLTKPPTFSGILGTRQGGAMLFDVKVNADKVHGDIGDGERWIDTKVNFYADDVGSDGRGGRLELDRWHLVTYVIDVDACRLYLDGDLKKTLPFTGRPRLLRPGGELRIGDTGAGEYMDGVIDDVRIYKEPLSTAQVQALARP